ncbi:MAG: rhombosortase [Betaproteobacteria bacterium]
MQLSAAERQALGGAALVLLVQAIVPLHGALEYRQALVASQPWRALTAHLVHVNWVHALLNLAAWLVVARLFAPELRTWRQPLVLAVAALAVTLHLALLHPGIAWYRGFSGTLHGVFFAGASAWLLALLADGERRPRALWLPAVLVAGGWVKVLAEQPGGSLTPYAQWLGAGIVPQAHLAGAVAGSVLGVLCAWRGTRPSMNDAGD